MIGDRQQVRLSEASRELGVARSTAHRLMQMLQFHGFVRQDSETKAYVAGAVLFDMGLQVVRSLDLRSHARPILEGLASSLHETVQLSVLQHDGLVACVEVVEGPRTVKVSGRVGTLLPALATSAGRAILSEMRPAQIDLIYPTRGFPRSHSTIASRSQLNAVLEQVHTIGYSIERGEIDDEVTTISVAILNPLRQASFALTLAMPSVRLSDKDIPHLVDALSKGGAEIAHALPW
jgi:DNA-binding IclR family transcriptional regulator